MLFKETIEKLNGARIIPLVAVEDKDKALGTVSALAEGGIKAVEIAFRTTGGKSSLDAIARCIEECAKAFPQIAVGAGTVINAPLAKQAAEAGASFIVSPGFNHSTVAWCIEHGEPIIPGVNSPTQIECALGAGLEVLKFFPAELTGGVKWLKAMSGPFPQVSFVATGGINENNVLDYLNCPNCAAICGSYIATKQSIAAGDYPAITANARCALSVLW